MKIKYNEMEKCPLCGSNDVEYNGMELCGEGLYHNVECNHCHTTWREWYNVVFGEVYEVYTKEGERVDND